MLAEDNPGDVLLFREALRHSEITFELMVADDGEKALRMLEKACAQDIETRPDLIVLDVNLPRRSGQDVLRWVRSNPGLAHVPVMVLTSSSSPDDKAKAMQMGADLYVQKSSSLEEVFELGTKMERLLREKSRKT
jgi:two-component system, chemotaxis family, response regulator Rcp1